MTYKLYQMSFQTAHFGHGDLALSEMTFTADRLFSALVLESIKQQCLESFMVLAHSDDFVLSDAFPMCDVPYLPKPIGYPKRDEAQDTRDVVAMRQEIKKVKKLQYLPYNTLKDFLAGYLPPATTFAKHRYVTKNQPSVEGNLYQVGVTYFQKKCNLYVIARESELLNSLMTSLQFSGLGGKRSSGYGRFELSILPLPSLFEERVTTCAEEKVILLTSSIPIADELEGSLKGANYLLGKFSGFAFSHANQSNLRKQDFYKFKAGSTFVKTFNGQIVDVRPLGFEHPVWHFAKPLFYRLGD